MPDYPKEPLTIWKSRKGDGLSVLVDIQAMTDFLATAPGDKAWISLFPNRYKKEGDKQPDFKMPRKKDDSVPF